MYGSLQKLFFDDSKNDICSFSFCLKTLLLRYSFMFLSMSFMETLSFAKLMQGNEYQTKCY